MNNIDFENYKLIVTEAENKDESSGANSESGNSGDSGSSGEIRFFRQFGRVFSGGSGGSDQVDLVLHLEHQVLLRVLILLKLISNII